MSDHDPDVDAAEDIKEVAMILASDDLDDDAAEENVSEAMWLIKDSAARAELSGSLGIEVADNCTSDDGYVRSLSLFLNALVLEVEAVSETDGTSPTHTCKNLAKAVCHLIVRSATVDPTEVDMVQEAMDILTENLQDEYTLGAIVTESFLTVARSPISHSNRGDYGPALILAFHMHKIAPPPDDDPKYNSDKENTSEAFRRDVMDLFGRRVFVLGGTAPPATPEEVLLAAPLIMELTKEEFDGAILRPLKFKLMSAPRDTMGTLAAFVDVLAEAGNGGYIDSHLGGGTNLVGVALKQIKTEEGMVGAAKVMAALAKASPAKGAVAVADAMAEELRDSVSADDETAKIGLCLGLEAVARGLLSLTDEGIEDEIWQELAEDVAIPALEEVGGYDGANSAAPWYELAGLEPPPPPEEGMEVSRGGAVAGAAGAAAVARGGASGSNPSLGESYGDTTYDDDTYDDTNTYGEESTYDDDPDKHAKEMARGAMAGAAAARQPGVQQASALDDRIQRKQAGANGSSGSAYGRAASNGDDNSRRSDRDRAKAAAAGAAVGAGIAVGAAAIASNGDDPAAAKARAAGGGAAANGRASQLDRLEQRIAAKSGGGAAAAAAPRSMDEDKLGSAAENGGGWGDNDWDQQKKDDLDKGGDDGWGDKGFGDEGQERPQAIASHGATVMPDVERGVDEGGIVDGPDVDYGVGEGDEGLAVAVAVSPDEEEQFIPAAIEYDPDSKPPLIKNRRFRVYACLAAIVLIVAVAGVAVGVTMNTSKKGAVTYETIPSTQPPTATPTAAPTPAYYLDALETTITNLVGDKWKEEGTPAAMAANWIINEDPMQLGPRDPNIAQRYLLALLFFEWNGMDWTECTPTGDPNDVECEATCFDWLYGNPFDCDKKRWLTNSSECGWLGITCPEDGTVRGIELIFNNLNGTLPTEIAKLEQLQTLSLIENWIEGTIPTELVNMKYLIDLELNWNLFTGTLPDDLFDSRILFRLNTYHNLMTGTLSENVGNLPALEGIHFGENAHTGTIPTQIGQVKNLGYAQWNDNLLTGQIPTEIGNLRRLRQWYVDGNMLTGTIPTEIGTCALLEDFWIRGNDIAGWIPDQFYDLSNLFRFYAQDNALSGTLSPQVAGLVSMEDFTIRGNFMSGTIPQQFSTLQNLTELWLHFNDFTGTTSDRFCDQLDLSLQDFRTDCAPTQPGNLPPFVSCPCCTHCCDHSSKCVKQ